MGYHIVANKIWINYTNKIEDSSSDSFNIS
jgi:hypothetical protein